MICDHFEFVDVLQHKWEARNREDPYAVTVMKDRLLATFRALSPKLAFLFCEPALILEICKIYFLREFVRIRYTICTFLWA